MDISLRILVKSILHLEDSSFLDKNNILWKSIDGELLGKRCLTTYKYGNIWYEDLKSEDDVQYWLHNKNCNWEEIFKWI